MRLITHNMLKCNAKGVTNGYPLIIEAHATNVIESDFSSELIKTMLKRIQIDALKSAAKDLGLPDANDLEQWNEETIPDDVDEDFLRKVHHLLFEVHVSEGFLVCPESGRKFPIKDGIPNMLLHEDEI